MLGSEGKSNGMCEACKLTSPTIRSLERHVFPTIGALPIGELYAPIVLEEAKG